jgi:glucokinase
VLLDMLGDDLKDLRSGDLRKAIRKGDKFVEGVIEKAAEYVGIATGNLINVLNPEVVVLGGGVIDALQSEMMPIIISVAKKHALTGTDKGVEIIASKTGDDAGIIGAAVLAQRMEKR